VKRSRVGITGSPATGKKTVGKALAARLDVPFLSLNDVARRAGFVARARAGEPKLDTRGFSRVANRYLPQSGFVLAGVLLAEAVPARLLDYVVVLRCSPLVLAERYRERGYPEMKRKENLTAEFLDECLGEALIAYRRKVREVDTTGKDLQAVVGEVGATLKKGDFPVGRLDWLSLVKGPEDVFRFML
jgi:adenylate kinase